MINIIKKSTVIETIGGFLLMISVSSVFLQFYSEFYSKIISPTLIVSILLFFSIQKNNKKSLLSIIIPTFFITFNYVQSIFFQENSIPNATRFYIILVVLLLSLILKIKKKIVYVIITIIFFFSLLLIFKEIYYITHSGAWIIDRQVWKAKGIGDVYSYGGYFYKIQIKGNALIPVSLFVSYFAINNKKIKFIYTSIFFIAVLVAGNAMYILSLIIFTFLIVQDKISLKLKLSFKNMFLLSVVLITIALLLPSLKEQFLLKSQSSYPIRVDQAIVLWNDMTSNIYTFLFGKGLGNFVDSSTSFYRDYSGSTYFELQTLYIINQLGVLVFSVYSFFIYHLMKLNWNYKSQFIVFFSYFIYAISNPYIFDVTNVIVFILITNMVRGKDNDK